MSRPVRLILILVLVLVGFPFSQAAAQEGSDAQQRMTQLAQRFASADPVAAPPSTPKPSREVAAPSVPIDAEALPLGTASDPAADAEQQKLAPPLREGWVLSTLASLGVVIALILFARWAYARLGGTPIASSSSNLVELLSRTAVAPKNHVLLLRVGSRILVTADSGSGMRTLCEITDPEEVATLIAATSAARPDSFSRSFGDMIARIGQHTDVNDADGLGTDQSETHCDAASDTLSSLRHRLHAITGGAA